MFPRPRAEGGAGDDRSAAAGGRLACSPISRVVPLTRLPARSLLLFDLQAGGEIAMCAVFVSSGSLVVPLLVSCRRARLVVRVGWRWVVVALRRGGVWLPWCGRYVCCVAICDAMRSGVAWGGSVMSCRAAGRERDEWRDDECAVFVSSIWSFPCCYRQVWGPRGVLGLLHREII